MSLLLRSARTLLFQIGKTDCGKSYFIYKASHNIDKYFCLRLFCSFTVRKSQSGRSPSVLESLFTSLIVVPFTGNLVSRWEITAALIGKAYQL